MPVIFFLIDAFSRMLKLSRTGPFHLNLIGRKQNHEKNKNHRDHRTGQQ